MIVEETIQKLTQLRLSAMAGSLKNRLGSPDHQDLSHEEFVGLIVDDEWIHRENKKFQRRLENARFKIQALIPQIDHQIKRGLNKSLLLELAGLKWIINRQNIILTGPTGVGKSFIAQALGHQACTQGYTVHFLRLSKMLNQIYLARADGSYPKLLAKLAKFDVMILDDWGVSPLKEQESQDLLEVIEDRSEIKSTVITTQLPIKHWHEFIGNQTIADALCDRLIHNAYKIDLTGESIRKQKEIKTKCPPEKP